MAKHGKDEMAHPAFQYGTDAQFLKWVSTQPSIFGGWNQTNPNRNIPCHVRRIHCGAGMGIKPPFSAVPMTDEQHKLQSGRNGQARCLQTYRDTTCSPEKAGEWFEKKRDEMVKKWIETRKGKA